VHLGTAGSAASRSTRSRIVARPDTAGISAVLSDPLRSEGTLELAAVGSGIRWAVGEDEHGTARWNRLADRNDHRPDALIQASASDLLLYLYRRRPAGDLPVTGDFAVAERFALRTGTD
jgi:hypothetical protein